MLVSGSATRTQSLRMKKYGYANKLKAHNRNQKRQEQ